MTTDRLPAPAFSLEQRQYLAVILLLFTVVTVAGAYWAPMEWDEGAFLGNAEYFLGDDANVEESRPAALSYLIAGVWTMTGESTFAGRLVIVLFGLACIVLFQRIAAQEFDNPLPPTLGFAAAPLLLYWSFHAYTDVPALALVLGSLYLYRNDRFLAAGVVMAAAVTVRYVFAPFAIGMAIAVTLRHRDDLLRYAAGGIVGSAPFFAYSYFNNGGIFARIRMYVTRAGKWSDSGLFAATVPSLGSAVTMLSALLPGAYTGWDETPAVEKWLVIVYSAFFLFISGNSFPRYWLPVTPLLLLMAYRGLDLRRFLVIAGITIVVSGTVIGGDLQAEMTCQKPFVDAVEYVRTETTDGAVVSDNWAITGYLVDRRVHSPWTDYTTLQQQYDVRYAITQDDLPYRQIEQFANTCQTYRVYDLTQGE